MADRVQLRWVNKPNRRHLSGIPPSLTSLPMLYTLEVLLLPSHRQRDMSKLQRHGLTTFE